MDVASGILDAIEIIVDKKVRENTAQIYLGICKSVSGNTCVMLINGKDNTVQFYGSTPVVGSIYRVFVPNGNMSMAFVITGTNDGSGGSSPGVTSYTKLTELPTINGVVLQEGATSKSLSLYGIGNEPNYPVTKVNGKTGEVVIDEYSLPIASDTVLGGIKIGSGLTINSDGVLSALPNKADAIVCKSSGYVITLDDSCDCPLSGLNIYGKTTQDGTPTPDAPVELVSVGNRGVVKTTVCGKNLLSLLNPIRNNNTNVLASLTDNAASISRVVSGVWQATNFYYYLPAGTYTVSAKMNSNGGYTNLSLYKCDSLYGKYTYFLSLTKDGKVTFNLDVPTYIEFRLHWSGEVGSNGEIWTTRYYDIMLEQGSTATAYEAYQGNTVAVQTPNGLPGIPVNSGGNYTDSSGQQWICDEVDFARGVYVQRVNNVHIEDCNGVHSVGTYSRCQCSVTRANNNFSNKAMNTLFPYSSDYEGNFEHAYVWGTLIYWFLPKDTVQTEAEADAWLSNHDFRFVYVLETPIETALSDEELAAYAALRTNYQNTSIINDSGAWMEIAYQADTKLYIDKQFAELRNAIVALSGNV